MRSNALLTIGSLFLFGIATTLWLVDRPSSTLAATPGVGYRCANTPAPFWTMGGECRCVIPHTPSDFCNKRMPPYSGSDNIEFRYCTLETGFSCNLISESCGDRVFNCKYAKCNTESEPGGPPENPWGCEETDKPPEICSSKHYTWCQPVEYP